jgi:hypothetical protein
LRRHILGQAKVDDSRRGLAIYIDYQDVRRLQVSMDNRFLVCVLYPFALG